MSCSPEPRSFVREISPPEQSSDMTEGSVSRHFSAPIHTYLCFLVASLTLCLLAALGIIIVLVIQRTGSVAHCDGSQRPPPAASGEAMKSLQSRTSEKAMAYLQVLKPINGSQLRWNSDGLLYNIQYDQGSLVIQTPGTYFLYCHLQFYIHECEAAATDLRLSLLVDGTVMKQTVLTLCSPPKVVEGVSHDILAMLLMELDTGARVSVQVDQFAYLDADNLPSSNVLGAFRYTGEDWKCPFLGTITGKCL